MPKRCELLEKYVLIDLLSLREEAAALLTEANALFAALDAPSPPSACLTPVRTRRRSSSFLRTARARSSTSVHWPRCTRLY